MEYLSKFDEVGRDLWVDCVLHVATIESLLARDANGKRFALKNLGGFFHCVLVQDPLASKMSG